VIPSQAQALPPLTGSRPARVAIARAGQGLGEVGGEQPPTRAAGPSGRRVGGTPGYEQHPICECPPKAAQTAPEARRRPPPSSPKPQLGVRRMPTNRPKIVVRPPIVIVKKKPAPTGPAK